MAGEIAAEWIKIPDGNGGFNKVWLRDSTARRSIAQLQTEIADLSAADVGAVPLSQKGAASGVAELDANGLVPSSQLPSYVDDVLEYASSSSFPATGETGKIYVDLGTNLTYRWSGSAYVEISPSLALGTTSSTAYRGDRGSAAYEHAVTNKGSAFASGLYKITTNSEGHVTGAAAVAKADITALGIPGSVPSKTSDLNNDSGFITASNVPTAVSELTNDAGYITTETDPTVPSWAKASTKPSYTASEVGALPDDTVIPTVPTNVSAFVNDAGYMTSFTETDPTVPSWAKSASKPTYTASEVGALPSSTTIPTKTSDLTNDSGFITGYTETDPTVPAWAKAANKPSYTAAEVGALPDTTPIPTVPTNVSAFTNDAGYLTSYTETDPTVPAWAKAAAKPTYTAAEVGALPDSALSPTAYSTLSPYNSRCTVDSGGYIKIGKMVFIDLVITTSNSASTTAFSQMISNTTDIKPLKSVQYTVLTAVNNTSRTKTTKAIVNTDGGILICNVAASEVVYITGCYISA